MLLSLLPLLFISAFHCSAFRLTEHDCGMEDADRVCRWDNMRLARLSKEDYKSVGKLLRKGKIAAAWFRDKKSNPDSRPYLITSQGEVVTDTDARQRKTFTTRALCQAADTLTMIDLYEPEKKKSDSRTKSDSKQKLHTIDLSPPPHHRSERRRRDGQDTVHKSSRGGVRMIDLGGKPEVEPPISNRNRSIQGSCVVIDLFGDSQQPNHGKRDDSEESSEEGLTLKRRKKVNQSVLNTLDNTDPGRLASLDRSTTTTTTTTTTTSSSSNHGSLYNVPLWLNSNEGFEQTFLLPKPEDTKEGGFEREQHSGSYPESPDWWLGDCPTNDSHHNNEPRPVYKVSSVQVKGDHFEDYDLSDAKDKEAKDSDLGDKKEVAQDANDSVPSQLGRANSYNEDECKVCYEKAVDTKISPCGHEFCNTCTLKLTNCPLCRGEIESWEMFQPRPQKPCVGGECEFCCEGKADISFSSCKHNICNACMTDLATHSSKPPACPVCQVTIEGTEKFNPQCPVAHDDDKAEEEASDGDLVTDQDVLELPQDPSFGTRLNDDQSSPFNGRFKSRNGKLLFRKTFLTRGHGKVAIYSIHPLRDEHRKFIMKDFYLTSMYSNTAVRLNDETKALKAIPPHDNIVKVYWIGEYKPKEACIVMEHLEHGDLGTLSARLTLPDFKPTLAFIAKSVLQALAHMHRHGITHNDIRPENIAVAADGTVKLIDFGSAGEPDPRLGYYAYKAAERYPNIGGGFTNKVDVYSLGMSLLALSSSRLYPMGVDGSYSPSVDNFYQSLRPSEKDHFPFPDAIEKLGKEDDYYQFLERCLLYNPTQRANVAELLRHRFLRRATEKQDLLSAMQAI